MEVISMTDNEIVVKIEVYNSPDLTALILGYQSDVEVLEPNDLRKDIKAVLEKTLSIYR